ncbi:MAG TPA: hypothetical protein GX711_02715, partial [Clostridia bacterium]|nr:hypothetical protein [Clostridia bacterium]
MFSLHLQVQQLETRINQLQRDLETVTRISQSALQGAHQLSGLTRQMSSAISGGFGQFGVSGYGGGYSLGGGYGAGVQMPGAGMGGQGIGPMGSPGNIASFTPPGSPKAGVPDTGYSPAGRPDYGTGGYGMSGYGASGYGNINPSVGAGGMWGGLSGSSGGFGGNLGLS